MKRYEGGEVHTIDALNGAGVTVTRVWNECAAARICEERGWLGIREYGFDIFRMNATLLKNTIMDAIEPSINGLARVAYFIYRRTPRLKTDDTRRATEIVSDIMDALEKEAIVTYYEPEYSYCGPFAKFTEAYEPYDPEADEQTLKDWEEEMRKQAEEDNEVPF